MGTIVLADLLDVERLADFIARGLISRRRHPAEDLYIYDYTARAVATATWTPETRACRGLIADGDGRVVARPFPKFFSLDEIEAQGPRRADHLIEVSEKLDGSLGILYEASAGPAIATRGAFGSPQACWASTHWRRHYGGVIVDPGVTLLFEVIYPANRVVVDYGERAELVLLAALDIETGADVPLPDGWPGPIVHHLPDIRSVADLRTLVAEAPTNREGVVVRFVSPGPEPSVRAKLKFPEYARVHRLVTTTTARAVWQHLRSGQSVDALVDGVPEGFAEWVAVTAGGIKAAFTAIETQCQNVVEDPRVDRSDRANTAEYFRTASARDPLANAGVLFKMLDAQPYAELIWRAVRPREHRTYRPDIEHGIDSGI